MIKLRITTYSDEKAVTILLYNINDSYYINLAIDRWLDSEDPDYYRTEDEDEKITTEGCMPDD